MGEHHRFYLLLRSADPFSLHFVPRNVRALLRRRYLWGQQLEPAPCRTIRLCSVALHILIHKNHECRSEGASLRQAVVQTVDKPVGEPAPRIFECPALSFPTPLQNLVTRLRTDGRHDADDCTGLHSPPQGHGNAVRGCSGSASRCPPHCSHTSTAFVAFIRSTPSASGQSTAPAARLAAHWCARQI